VVRWQQGQSIILLLIAQTCLLLIAPRQNVRDRFVNLVRLNNPGWEVHSIAQPGDDTGAQILGVGNFAKAGYQFEEVVLVYCLNDVSELFPEWIAASQAIYSSADKSGWLFKNSYVLNTLYFLNARRSNPYMREYFTFIKNGYAGEKWEQQKARLRELRRTVENHGGRLRVVTFPFMEGLGDDYGYTEAHQALKAFWDEEKVPHLDLLPALRAAAHENLTVNPADPHPNEIAHKIAAEEIQEFLKRLPANNKTGRAAPRPAQPTSY
jgi:hypothetical protein